MGGDITEKLIENDASNARNCCTPTLILSIGCRPNKRWPRLRRRPSPPSRTTRISLTKAKAIVGIEQEVWNKLL